MSESKHTPVFHGPFEYVPGTENHGPYVTNAVGNTICDCYVMTQPAAWSVRTPVPVNHCGEMAEDYACLFGASFELLEVAKACREVCLFGDDDGIGVSEDVVIPSALFDRICAVVNKAEGRS